jgi:hypothetical protein
MGNVHEVAHQVAPDAEDRYGIIARLRDAMAPGSYLALTRVTR